MTDRAAAPALAPQTRQTRRAILLAILLLAGTLRVLALTKPYYIDEISTLTVASQPLDQMAGVMRKIDASPALYPVALHAWIAVSHADAWVRLLSALFGLGAVWAAYRLAAVTFGDRTAVLTAFVVAVAPIHIEYAQYVRGYSLFTLVALLQLWAFARCLVPPATDPRPVRPFVWLALATAAMFYTHYLSFLVLAPEGLYALWRVRHAPQRVIRTGVAVLVAAVLFIPGLSLFAHNLQFDAQRNLDRASAPAVVKVLPDLFGQLVLGRLDLGFSDPTVRRASLAAGLLLVGTALVAGVLAGWRRNRDATIALALFAVLPILIYVGSGRKLVAVRFFLPFGMVLLVLVAHGIASFERRWRLALACALGLLCAVPISHFVRRFAWSYDHRTVARAIDDRWRPGDIILSVHPFEILYYRWYLGPDREMRGLTFTPLAEQDTYVIKPAPLLVDEAKNRVIAATKTHGRVWVIGQSPRSFSSRDEAEQGMLLDWMDGYLRREDDLAAITHDDPVVRLYQTRAAPDARTIVRRPTP